ncbi:MAG: IclR family transcriptional regulator [Thermovirga sp.]
MSSLQKALRILRTLAEPPFEYSLTELSRQMEASKSGLHKLLQELREDHFIVQDSSTKKYHLGPISLRLGMVVNNYLGISEIAEPVLEQLLQTINETVYVCVWEGDRVVVVCKRTRPGALYEYNDFIGKSLPVNGGSSGRLLTAYQDQAKIRRLLKGTYLEKRTPRTLTDEEDLIRDYSMIREQGYCLEDETFSLGVMGISLPIFDKTGRVSSCVAMNAVRNEENMDKVPFWIQMLRNSAEAISSKLQFRHC